MVLKKDQIEDIARRLDFIRIQLGDLGKFSSLDWETYRTNRDIQRNVERLAENVANATIDICKILLVDEEVELPNSYKEIILKLGELKVLDMKQAEKIADYAGLRNVLAHQYLDIKWQKIKDFIASASGDFEGFIQRTSEKIGV